MGDWSHLFEGQLACQFETHHHHAGNPEEQDVMARLQQGAGVKHLQVLILEPTTTNTLGKTQND